MDVKRISIFILFFLILIPVFSQLPDQLKFSEGLAAQKSILKQKKSVYGFVNQKGKVIIPHSYDTVYANFKFGFACVGRNNRAGVIDKKGKMIIAFDYKEIGELTKFHIPVKNEKGLWGFYNHEGEKISDPLYQNFRYGGKGKIMVQKDGKWGMINDKGELLLDYHYKGIQHLSEKNYDAWKVTTWNVKNNKNETILSAEFDSLRYAGEGLYRFSMIGKKGLMDSQKKVVVSTEYEELSNFKFKLAKAKKDRYGVINPAGQVVIPFQYDDLIIDSLFVRVKIIEHIGNEYKAKWGLFNHKGVLLIKPKYAIMNAPSEGVIAAMREDGTWGYISSSGSTEIIFRYSYAEDFFNGLARVKVPYSLMHKDLFALIDKTGEYIISPADYNFYTLGLIKIDRYNKIKKVIPSEKYSSYEKVNRNYVRVMNNGKYGMITTDGIEIIPTVYDYVSDPSETGLMVLEKEGKIGVVDGRGNFTFKLSNRYEKIFGYREGFSKMQLKGKYGFIDLHGDVWISAQYPEAGEMSDSMVNVILKGKWGFVDYKENLKVQPYYEEVKPFKNGIAQVKENGKWNIINKEGKQLHKNDLDQIEKLASGRYLLYLGGKVGMADKRGREILALKYEKIEEIGNNMVKVRKNGLWGVLDYNENFIIPIEHDVIIYEASNNTFVTAVVGKQEHIHIK